MVIRQWSENGVNFCDHLYVPEVHPITGKVLCKMEDEGYVFKVRNLYTCNYTHTLVLAILSQFFSKASSLTLNYRIAGNFGKELILAVWRL